MNCRSERRLFADDPSRRWPSGVGAAAHAAIVFAAAAVGAATEYRSCLAWAALTEASHYAGLLATLYLISYAGAAAPGLVAGRLATFMAPDQIAYGYGALVLIAAVVAIVALRGAQRAASRP